MGHSSSLTLTIDHRISNESLWTLALETSHVIAALSISPARRPAALVVIRAAGGARISIEAWRAVATITALQVCTERSRSTRVGVQETLVEVHTPIVWIPLEALLAQTRVVARRVYAVRVDAARTGQLALVDVQAQLLAVALVSWLALAQEMSGQVAALRVLHASRGNRWICTLIDVCERGRRIGGFIEMHSRDLDSESTEKIIVGQGRSNCRRGELSLHHRIGPTDLGLGGHAAVINSGAG